MAWTVATDYSRVPNAPDRVLVRLDIMAGARRIGSVTIRPDHDEAWHLKQAHRIAAVHELYDVVRASVQYLDETIGLNPGARTLVQTMHAALTKAEGR